MSLILGIDTETTGVSNEDEVIQVAAVLVNHVDYQVVDRFVTLFSHTRPIHPKAQEVHGITPEMCVGQPTLSDILSDSKLAQWVEQSSITFGHNVSFDIRMLKSPAIGMMQVIDTLAIVRTLFPAWSNHRLTTCVSNLNLPEFKAHDALGDIEATANILRHLSQDRGLGLQEFIQMTQGLKRHFLDVVLKAR